MDQLEHIPNSVDSSMQVGLLGPGISNTAVQLTSTSNIQMGTTGSVSSSALSQHLSVSNHHAQLLEPMATNHVAQKFPVSNFPMGQLEPQAYNTMMRQQYLLPNKQPGEIQTIQNNVGLQQLATLSKRKAPIETMSNMMPSKRPQLQHRPWLQQVSGPNKLPVQTQSTNTAVSPRLQPPSRKPVSTKTGTQLLSVQKSQTGQLHPSPKSQNESASVRLKLRESLAGALPLVSQQQSKTSSFGKNSQNDTASPPSQEQKSSQPSGATDSGNHVTDEAKGSAPSATDSLTQNSNGGLNTSQEILTEGNSADSVLSSRNKGQQFSSNIQLRDEDNAFSDSFFVKDELLQGNGLSWVLEPVGEVMEEKDVSVVAEQPGQQDTGRNGGEQPVYTPEAMAAKIESELFKLFGGVNKKYKEKGRSLLFNLKDRNNPELRERVMSGDIPPERLCSMTAEELASRELSQWRREKAEEMAQMVVLPDTDVDVRRLVKKTHKGEFQVEMEEQDNVSVEVAVGATSVPRMQRPKPDQAKEKENLGGEKNNSDEQDVPYTLTIPSSDGSDLMQGLMVDDELKDAEFLPPIVSLDEFMESLNSEPPFENLPVDAEKPAPVPEKDDSPTSSESKSPDAASKDPVGATPKLNKSEKVDVTNTKSDSERKSVVDNVKSVTKSSATILNVENVWEGLLQLNISAMASVIGIFKSGEKTSLKDWPGFIEIKGRVRLDAFEKFLQELPMSRSRAVMAVHFVSKDGSGESERASIIEVADSYVLDGRVGFAEPAPGMELYLCPPHSKTHEMLNKVLPRDQVDTLNAINNGLIGVVVWRKAHITPPSSTASPSNHKHNSKKQHFTSRRHHDKDSNMNVVNMTIKTPSSRDGPPPGFPQTQTDDDVDDDDVPPGFGPPGGRDEDDLPEFNFSTSRPNMTTQNITRGHGMVPHNPHPSRPAEQMRELVHRYGQPNPVASSGIWQDKRGIGVPVQQWNDDDDDMPEWHPEESQYQRPQPQPGHVHGIQPTMLRPHMVQQMPMQPQVHGAWMAPPTPTGGGRSLPAYQSNGGQFCGLPGPGAGAGAGQQGMAWRSDTPRSRGF